MSGIQLKVWGDFACFTRPEMKVERVSYDVMTPSAARGVLEAILWKPAIVWEIHRIDVLKPVRWFSVRRNEVSKVASVANAKKAMNGNTNRLAIDIEEARQPRAGLILRDVAYVIHARFRMTGKAGAGDEPAKFREMFERRARKGQCFHRPYLGCREFAAHFEWHEAEQSIPLAEYNSDLGFMLHDMAHHKGQVEPRFFRAEVASGSIEVPPFHGDEVFA